MSFLEQAPRFLALTVTHALVMFPYLTLPPFLISPLLQIFGRDAARRRLLRNPTGDLWKAMWLGVCSPPGRSRSFEEARGLFIAGVSGTNVVAYLIAAHSLTVYMPFLILALNGPQPVIGLGATALLSVLILKYLLRGIPAEEWEKARTTLANSRPAATDHGASNRGIAVARALFGDLRALWWPLLFGATLGAIIAAWGLSTAFFSIQGSNGVQAQIWSAFAGLLLSHVSAVPAVGNVYPAAWLWKAEFFSYAGLMTFYLGALVTPFALPRYAHLFGRPLAWKVGLRLVLAILLSALTVTAFWYALDWALQAAGLAAPLESLIDSTIRPNQVPWFHTLFWSHNH